MEDGPIAPTHLNQFLQPDLQHIDVYWRAVNYLTEGQI